MSDVARDISLPCIPTLLVTCVLNPPEIPNPFAELGDIIAKAAADAWTAAMLAIWNSGLFVLRIVLTFSEVFLTPELRADGPGKDVYAFTLWLALAVVVILGRGDPGGRPPVRRPRRRPAMSGT